MSVIIVTGGVDPMDNVKYRCLTKVVAIFDLFLTLITSWFPLGIFVAAVGLTLALLPSFSSTWTRRNYSNDGSDFSNSSHPDNLLALFYVIGIWVVFILVTVIIILEIVAAVKLFNSTQLGIDPASASKLARFWRTCTIVFTVLVFVSSIVSFSVIFAANLIFRIVGIIIVHSYTKELDICSQSLSTSAQQVMYNISGDGVVLSQPPPSYPGGQSSSVVYGNGTVYSQQPQGYVYAYHNQPGPVQFPMTLPSAPPLSMSSLYADPIEK